MTFSLKQINKTAATEVEFPGGQTVLFSYQTPVAVHVPGVGYFRTERYWSVSTTRHINQFLRRNGASKCGVVPQEAIAAYVS